MVQRRRRRPGGPGLLPALLAASVLVASAASAATPAAGVSGLAAVRALRDAGRIEDALAAARREWRAAPADVDRALLYGQLLYATGAFGEARRLLAGALERAPDYVDLRLALARALAALDERTAALATLAPLEARGEPVEALLLVARLSLADGDGARAAAALATARRRAPDDPRVWLAEGDRLAGEGRVELASVYFERVLEAGGAEAELARRRLRGLRPGTPSHTLVLSTSASRFRGGARDPWGQLDLAFEWRTGPSLSLRAELSERRRFGTVDTVIGAGLSARLDRTVLGATLRASPAPDFSPTVEVRLTLEAGLFPATSPFGATDGRIEAHFARYDAGTVSGIGLGVTRYGAGGTDWFTLLASLTRDEAGRFDRSLSARLDVVVADRWRLFAGSAFARDGTEDGTVAERTVFAGCAWRVRDDLELSADLAHVGRRGSPDRVALGLGVRLTF